MNILIRLGELPVRIGLRFPETEGAFRGYILERDCEGWDICVRDEDIARFPLNCPEGVLTPAAEAYILMALASEYMLPLGQVVFHGVSIVWRGKAWLITAPSGTGKTTQLRHWQHLFPGEFEIINGDKSILRLDPSGIVWVHPSPWTGKERDAGFASAELAGIVVLEQAKENSIRLLNAKEAVLRIYEQFLMLGEGSAQVLAAARMETAILTRVPVWLLRNLGDEDSARLTHETLSEFEARTHEGL